MEQELARVQEIYTFIVTFLVTYGFQLLGAIFILLLGAFVARKAGAFIESLLVRHKVDVTLSQFAASTGRILLMAMVVIIALGKVGISVTPFVAAIGALGLGAGLALQGMLSNYGAGISIILTRPFVVGDTISVQGVTGVVSEIKLAYTILTNEDAVNITIPNKHIVGEIIHNSSTETIVESSVSVAYASDPEQVLSLVRAACVGVAGVSNRSAPQVGIQDFGDNGIIIGIRYWVPTTRYFQLRFAVNAAIHAAFKQHGIEIPYPQREVRITRDQTLPS